MREQFIRIDRYGAKRYYKDREMTILHREDGPAIEWADGAKHYYINNKFHRTDGPAAEYANGDKFWYINGERHREDGPAIECANGDKYWYMNGKKLTEEEFNVELTLDDIAAKFGVSVDRIKVKK